MRGEQFEGMSYSEFEKKVLEMYPFADIEFSGGGMLIIQTGMHIHHLYYDDKLKSAMHNGSSEIDIWTDLYLDDSNGEERIICERTLRKKQEKAEDKDED